MWCVNNAYLSNVIRKSVFINVFSSELLAYQKSFTTEHNQLAYLEISECYLLEDDIRVPAALPDVVHSVSLLEQWMREQSSPTGELNIYGRLVANSSLYKYTNITYSQKYY